jgi:hypothetical protein
MGTTPGIDELRAAFISALDNYTREGLHLKNLLPTLDGLPEQERRRVILPYQNRLSKAQQEYEHARTQYVRCVLGEPNGDSGNSR